MKNRKKVEWNRLDNASKIFPATCNDKDTKVFRIVCELNEAVKPDTLQQALNVTIENFTLYKSVLRRGLFWYYLENSDIHPEVDIESKPVCAPIYSKEKKNLLFRVFYFNNRINLEIFHALSDGTGALRFMQTLVHYYLVFKYRDVFLCKKAEMNYNASVSQQTDDSFGRYCTGKDTFNQMSENNKMEAKVRAYHIRGARLDENRIKVIEGSMSAKAVLEEAHKYNTTLTIFIAALFIYSISKDMPERKKNRPVVLSVPINLRQFYESETSRNFFSTMTVGYYFGKGSAEFKDIIQAVSEIFQEELTEERLNQRLNRFMPLEKNLLTRALPLPLKDFALRLASRITDRGITAAISNIGRISVPLEFDAYIRQFSVMTSARMPRIAMCTYGDRFVVSFASPFIETEINRIFFEFLSRRGIAVEVSSNI